MGNVIVARMPPVKSLVLMVSAYNAELIMIVCLDNGVQLQIFVLTASKIQTVRVLSLNAIRMFVLNVQ